MPKIKTSELTGAALDWAVAKCEGVKLKYGLTDDERYSTDWSQGGPIIEREFISLDYDKDWVYDPSNVDPDDEPDNGDRWIAWPLGDETKSQYGPTPLIAAMRCYTASKLGDEVEVPKGLLA